MMKKLLCSLILIITTVGFVQAQQDINIQGNSIDIVDGDTTPDLADHTDFGDVSIGSSLTRTFTIQNTGGADLNLTSIGFGFGTDSQFSIDASSTISPIAGGGSTTYTVTYTPTVIGVSTGSVSIGSDDPDAEATYTYSIQAEGIAVTEPDINVQGNSTDIADGDTTPDLADHTDFGQVTIGSSLIRTFTIQNTGTADLNISGLGFAFGTDSQFSLDVSGTVSPITGASSTTFTVTYTPTVTGVSTGGISITSDDPDTESTYTFSIQAEGVNSPDINLQGNGIDIIDGDTTPDLADHTDFDQVTIGSSLTRIFTIQNTGSVDLNLTGIGFGFGTDSQFSIDASSTISPITGAGSTTFTVTYTPTTAGVSTGGISITSDDPDAEATYTFSIQAEGIVLTEPDINIQGNSTDIVDGDTTPDLADHTDFGQVIVGSSLIRTFTIQNTGTADLNISGLGFVFGTDSQFSLDVSSTVSPITGASSTTFTVTYTPTVTGVSTGGLTISSDDPDAEATYTFSIQAESIIASEPEIDIFGLGQEITNGDTTPDTADDTDFGQADITSGSITHTFTIENNGASDLTLTGAPLVDIIGANPGDFTVTVVPTSPITASGNTTFSITFDPTALGVRTATVSIANDDSDEDPYTFDIEGEGIDANVGSPLLITQYYEGAGNDKWIEVKNISQSTVIAGSYNLALYTDFNTLSGTIGTIVPDQSVAIGTMASGDVRIFRNAAASLPLAGNLGSGTITDTNVCTFDGDDVILISTSIDVNCYNNRIDIIGVVDGVSPRTWGVDKGYIKGCGTNEVASLVFDATLDTPNLGDVLVNDYIELTLDEVNNAVSTTNIALGTQGIGSTTWTSSWSNEVPDRTRDAIISGTYTASNGSFETCNLTVSGNLNFNNSTSNFVAINEDLTVTGTFTIGDTESLITEKEDAIITGSITKIESSTSLVNNLDFTYWSSPVENASIASVFSSADLSRVFYWDQSAANIIPGGDVGDPTIILGEWIVASGTMRNAKGYISEGPSSGAYPQSHTISFTGAPNNGVISISGTPHMVFNNGGNTYDDYNLIGNPYPSAIDADAFISLPTNSDIGGTLWFWTHNTQNDTGQDYEYTTDDYASYNLTGGTAAGTGGVAPTQNIGSGQGFMVRAVSASPGVIFNNVMRLRDQNTQFFRGVETKNAITETKDRIWLNAESAQGGAFNQILVGFFDEATDGHDRGYDGLKNGASWIRFYSKIDSLAYGIQGLSSFNIDKKVPLGFDTYISAPLTYKISIHNIEGALNDNDVYLVDSELNITHDLKLADYEFDVNGTGNFPDRFTLQFTKSTLAVGDYELDNNSFVVINEEDAFRLKSNTVITHIKVYDMLGRLLINEKPNDNEFTINTHSIRKGTILILNATFDNGAEVSKKAIKY